MTCQPFGGRVDLGCVESRVCDCVEVELERLVVEEGLGVPDSGFVSCFGCGDRAVRIGRLWSAREVKSVESLDIWA